MRHYGAKNFILVYRFSQSYDGNSFVKGEEMTTIIGRERKKIAQRPGARVEGARKLAKRVAIAFGLLACVGIGLQIAEIHIPGMAWYIYE